MNVSINTIMEKLVARNIVSSSMSGKLLFDISKKLVFGISEKVGVAKKAKLWFDIHKNK